MVRLVNKKYLRRKLNENCLEFDCYGNAKPKQYISIINNKQRKLVVDIK